MKKLTTDSRINLYGSNKGIETAEQLITAITELPTMDERQARLALQRLIDNKKIKASILINGNSVWSYDRIIKDIKSVKKNGMSRMSDYLYHFLSLSCGSIAHYNKQGWIDVYPTIEHLKQFFCYNEFGQKVSTYLPQWKTDAIRIVEEIERLFEI
jgi:hypothetical protein